MDDLEKFGVVTAGKIPLTSNNQPIVTNNLSKYKYRAATEGPFLKESNSLNDTEIYEMKRSEWKKESCTK